MQVKSGDFQKLTNQNVKCNTGLKVMYQYILTDFYGVVASQTEAISLDGIIKTTSIITDYILTLKIYPQRSSSVGTTSSALTAVGQCRTYVSPNSNLNLTSAVLGASNSGFYNRFVQNQVNFKLIYNNIWVDPAAVTFSNTKLHKSDNIDKWAQLISSSLATLGQDGWLTLKPEALNVDGDYLFETTATVSGSSVVVKLYISSYSPLTSLNLVATGLTTPGVYVYNDPIQFDY